MGLCVCFVNALFDCIAKTWDLSSCLLVLKKMLFLDLRALQTAITMDLVLFSFFFLKIEKLFLVGSLKSCLGNKIGFP